MKSFLLPLTLLLASSSWAMPILRYPTVDAKSAMIVEAETGRVLFEKNADDTHFPASTTKIMSALLLLENRKLTDLITAPEDTKKITGSSLHLIPGEQITVEDALYAMLLRSANDVCHAVALNLADSEEAFADMMNARAAKCGAKNTHFHNSNGLNDPDHITCARDLSLIAREAMKNETFRKIVATTKWTIKRSSDSKDLVLKTRNTWLEKDPTADGIKTGYTDDAKHCYVGSATRGGFQVITVIMDDEKAWEPDNKIMLDWAFDNYQIGLVTNPETALIEAPLKDGVVETIPAAAVDKIRILSRRGSTEPLSIKWPKGEFVEAPVKAGQTIGMVKVIDADGFTTNVPVRAISDAARKRSATLGMGGGISFALVGGMLLCGAFYMRKRSRTF